MRSRKETDAGVRELQRLENMLDGRENVREGARGCDSMRATLRPAVEACDPIQS